MKNQNEKFITFIFGELPPHVTGGGEIFNFYLIKEIAKTHRITLIGASDPKIDGILFYSIKKLKPVRLFYPIQLFFSLCKRSINSSAIYTSYMTASWLMYISITLFSVIFRIPYSFTIHSGALVKWRFKLPYWLFFRGAKEITGVSHRICDEYYKRTGVQIKYLPPLIPFNSTSISKNYLRTKYNILTDKCIILFVGSLKPLKNPLNILKAIHILGREWIEQKKLFLVYAGDGVLKEDIVKYAEEKNLTGHMSLLGNVPQDFIHELYQIADLYVICSDYEGTPIALLEAMFHSLPILASDAPGINSILKNNESAILYNTKDCSELADGLQKLVSDPVKKKLIQTNANIYYNKNFNYQHIISEYIKTIDSGKIY